MTIIYHSQYPCNHSSAFQMDSRLITYTSDSCCSILPYPNEFELVLCETNPAKSHSESFDYEWKSAQSRRFLQESKFPILSSAKSNLSFLASAPHRRWFSIIYQNVFAYCVSMVIYQIGGFLLGMVAFSIWTIIAFIVLAVLLFLLLRPDPYKETRRYTRSSVEAARG